MKPLLEHGKHYHLFNRGNNYENIFIEERDYLHFLERMDIFISPVADIFAWCLMKNHFHILLRIKSEDEIGYLDAEKRDSEDPNLKWRTYFHEKPSTRFQHKPKPVEQFKHFFNAYSRWFNIRYERTGALFQKNYERKEVTREKYFTNLIVYIHNNPVKHRFVEHTIEYPWTSYLTIKSNKPTKLKRDKVIHAFNDLLSYESLHKIAIGINDKSIERLIIE